MEMTLAVGESDPSRPVLRYHGGKWRIGPWIISHFPKHRVYVEPFMGAASILLRKERVYCEVINDLDGRVVSLFKILRDPDQAEELRRRLELTPYARDEFDLAYEPTDDPIEAARRMMVRSWMGVSSRGATCKHRTGFRAAVSRRCTHPALDWSRLVSCLEAWLERLRGVLIESRPAIEVIQRYDVEDAVIYCDPPYLHGVRGDSGWNCGRAYRHEMSDEDHVELAEVLRSCAGMVLISGYDSDLYQDLYGGWRRSTIDTFKDSAQQKGSKAATEVLWFNEATYERLNPPLFRGVL
jgi:DNA adenine methylase